MLTGSQAQCEIQNLVRSVRKKPSCFFKRLVCEAAAAGAAAAMARACTRLHFTCTSQLRRGDAVQRGAVGSEM